MDRRERQSPYMPARACSVMRQEIRPRSSRFVNTSFQERLIPVLLQLLTFLLKFRGCDVTSVYSRL